MATFAEYTQQYMRNKKTKENDAAGKSFSDYTAEILGTEPREEKRQTTSHKTTKKSDYEQAKLNAIYKEKVRDNFLESEDNVGFWDAILPGGATPSEYKESRKKKKQYEKEAEEAAAQVAAYEQFLKEKEIEKKSAAEIDAYLAGSDAQIEKLEEEKVGFFEAMKPGGVKPSERKSINKEKEAEIKKIESQQGAYRAIRDEKKSHEMTDNLPDDVKELLDQYNNLSEADEGYDWSYIAGGFTQGGTSNSTQRASAYNRQEQIKKELTDRGYDNWVELAEYRKYITDKERAAQNEKEWSEFAEEHPVSAWGAARMMVVPSSVSGLYGTIKQGDSAVDFVGGNPYSSYYDAERGRQSVDETIVSGFEDGVLSADAKAFLYNAGTSAADSFVASATTGSLGLGKLSAGEVLLGLGAANSVIVTANEKGMSKKQAFTTAAVAMASEIAFEHFSLGKLGVFEASGEATMKAAMKDLLKNSFVNMTEEMATEIVNVTFDYYYNGGLSDYYQNYENYIANGHSEEEAKKMARADVNNQILEAGLSGAVIGGVFSAAESVENRINYKLGNKEAGKKAETEGDAEIRTEEATEERVEDARAQDSYTVPEGGYVYSLPDDMTETAPGYQGNSAGAEGGYAYSLPDGFFGTSTERQGGIDPYYYTLPDEIVGGNSQKAATTKATETAPGYQESSAGAEGGYAYSLPEGFFGTSTERQGGIDPYYYTLPDEIVGGNSQKTAATEVTAPIQEVASADTRKKATAKEQVKAALSQNSQDAAAFNAGFELYYEQGRSGGYQFTEIRNNPNVSESFTEYQRKQAFEQGQHQALKDIGNARYKGDTVAVFVNGYSGLDTVKRYASAFNIFYSEGMHSSLSFEEVFKREALDKVIDEGIARKAFEAGRNDPSTAKRSPSPFRGEKKLLKKDGSYVSKTISEGEIDTFLEAFSKKLGLDTVRVQRIIDGEHEANAQIDLESGKIVSSASSENEYQSTIHESVHLAYAYGDSKKMAEIESSMKDYFIHLHGAATFENVIRQYAEGYSDLDRAGVMEEFTADALAGVFSSEQGINEFVDWLQKESGYSQAEKKTILEKLSEWLLEIVDKIRELVAEGHLNSVTEAYANAQAEQFDDVRQKFLQVLDEIEGVEGAEGVKNSIKVTQNMDYGEQIDKYFSGTLGRSDSLYLGSPSVTLQKAGFSSNPFAMNKGDLRKSNEKSAKNKNYSRHGVPRKFFKSMPEYIDNSVVFIDNPNGITVVTDFLMLDEKGQPSYVIAGVKPDVAMEDDTVNLIKSVYPLDDFIQIITKAAESGKLVIVDKQKTQTMLATVGVQPSEVSRLLELSRSSISQNGRNVKSSDVKDRILADESDFRQSLKLNPVIAEGQLAFLDSRRAFITKRELKEAHRVTAAMVDVMMRHSEILPEDKVNKVLTKNGSYDISVENTTICLRTLAYNEFIDKVQEEIGRPLTQMESFLVSQKLYDIATDPQCLYCYVSLDRKAYNDMLLRYVQDRDSVIAKYNNSDKSPKAVEQLYKDFLHGRKATDPMRKRFDSWLKYADDGVQLLSLADIATEARQSEIAMKGGSLAEQLTDARRYAQSASWAKIQKNYVAYKDEILRLGDRVVSNLNKHYGLRWYSFSDYSPAFIVENMQQITDAAIRGLKGLSYTKDTDFARIFAPSGMNINVSVFVNADKDGNFYIDERQSAKLEEAIELRKQYPNVGIVATVTSDEALRWAGEQEWTDVIIPFHIVRTGTDVAEYYKWLNYTGESADTIKDKNLWDAYVDSLNIKSENARKKVSKNIYPNEHNNDKDTYLNLCQSRGLTPRFVRFAGESWYMKLVNETRLSAAESTKLKPVFNLEAAMKSFEKFIDKGGYEGGWYKADVDVDAEARAVADDVLAGKKANEVDYGRQDGFTPESVIASRKNNRSHGTKSSRKFSLDWIDFAEEQQRERSAVSELTELKKINEELRAQIRHPGVKHIVSQLGVQKVARHLKSEYMSKVNIHKLSGELGDFYTLIANGDGISWDSLQIHIERIADMILSESKYKKPDISDYAKDVLRDIRSVKIKLNDEQRSEVASEYGSYNEFRKKTMGTLVLSNEGMSLDERWRELSKAYPRLFPEGTADTDQPRVLMEKVAALRETYEDMNGMDLESARDMLMTEIYEQYFEVPETKYISEEYKLKYARAKAEFGEKIREAKADFKRQRDEAYQMAKAEYGEILKGIRAEEAEAILQAKARYNLRAEKMKDTRVREKKRANVIKQVKRLDKLLRTPGKGAPSAGTNKYGQDYVHLTNIPESLKKTVIDFCSVFIEHDAGVFSGVSKRDNVSQREKRIEAMQRQYAALKKSESYLKESVNDEMAEKLDVLSEIMAERRLSELTAEELDTVIEITDHLITVINNQVEMWVDGKKEKVEGLGSTAVDQLAAKGQYKHIDSKAHDFIKGWGVNNMKPVYFFERVGGVLEKLFLEMQNKGQRDYARTINAAAEFMDETSKKFDYKKWSDEEALVIKTTQGHTLKLTKAQAMHIWATAKREAIAGKDSRHIMQGGIVFEDEVEADVVDYGIRDKANNAIDKKKLTSKVWKYKKSDGSAHRISLDDLDKISEYLTDEQKKFVDTMVGYLSNDMAALGNEVSMELYGIKRFNEKYYIPFNSAKNFIYRSMGEQGEAMLRSESFTKETTFGANNPLVVGDFLDVVAGHIERMAMYNSMVLPLENFSKIWNFKTFVAEGDDSSSTVSVRSAMETAFGKSYVSYVDTLLKDINGGINADSREKSMGRLLSNFKKTAVLGSASVVIQQPSAIVRAFAEIDPSYFVASTFAGRKKAWEKALKYSSTALLKDIGGFDTVSGRGTVDWLTKTEYKGKEKVAAFFKDSQYRDDIIAWGPGFADQVTWAHIWAACEREVAHKNKGLQGEDLYRKTGERFDEVINKTQVYDSVLSRSAHMRSKSNAMQAVTSFMSEPTTQANMIASAMYNSKKGDKKKAARQLSSVIVSQLFNAALVSVIYAARDDDEEKTLVEKYLAELTGNFLGSLNPITMIPLFKDVWSMLEGYDIERSDMSVYSDIINACKAWNSDSKSFAEKLIGTVGSIGNAFGLPFKNILRDAAATVNVARSAGNISDTTGKGIWYAIEEDILPVHQNLKMWKPTTREEKLYAAFSEGDKKMYNRIASQYTSGGAIKSALKKQIGERFVEGDIDEQTAISQFRKLGLTENEAYYEVRSLKESLPEEESEDKNVGFFDYDTMQSTQGDDAESGKAKGDYDWLENALATGNRADIQKEINDLKGRGVSEDDINSKIKGWIKENDSTVAAEAERYKQGNLNSFESTVKSVAEKYCADESSVAGAIRSAAGDKSKAIEDTIYAYGDLHTSIGSMNTAQTQKIAVSIINAKTEAYAAEGYPRAEAQKKAKQSVRSSLTSEWKEKYLAADSTGRTQIRQQLYATGAYDNLNSLDKTLANWRAN